MGEVADGRNDGAETKLSRAKQLLYFPSIQGYRFRAGSGGVFLAATEIYISEFEASLYLVCQRVIGADGQPKVRHFPCLQTVNLFSNYN